MGTIEAVAKFFGFPENGTRKSLALIDAEGKPVVAIVPGDHELNDCKAEHVFGKGYRMMTDEELQTYGLHKGFIGPVNLPEGIRLVCDESLRESKQWACGANEVDYHFTGACPERDFTVDEWADLVTVVAGDPCPHCGKPLSAARGIEVSQVFQLGTKYSEAQGCHLYGRGRQGEAAYHGLLRRWRVPFARCRRGAAQRRARYRLACLRCPVRGCSDSARPQEGGVRFCLRADR